MRATELAWGDNRSKAGLMQILYPTAQISYVAEDNEGSVCAVFLPFDLASYLIPLCSLSASSLFSPLSLSSLLPLPYLSLPCLSDLLLTSSLPSSWLLPTYFLSAASSPFRICARPSSCLLILSSLPAPTSSLFSSHWPLRALRCRMLISRDHIM